MKTCAYTFAFLLVLLMGSCNQGSPVGQHLDPNRLPARDTIASLRPGEEVVEQMTDTLMSDSLGMDSLLTTVRDSDSLAVVTTVQE